MRHLLLPMLLLTLFTLAVSSAYAGSAVKRMRCYLEVDGSAFLNGWCRVALIAGGSLTVNVPVSAAPAPVFAEVDVAPDGTARAFWNEGPGRAEAVSPLGAVRRAHGCWSNARALICARR